MQRLYSTFANGWPGRGLLLLRLALCTFLMARSFAAGSRSNGEIWLSAILCIAGALLAAGLWTAILAGITGGIELWTAFTDAIDRDAHLLAAAIALGLAVLGPGAWSMDARLFGRRRISVQNEGSREGV